MHVIGIAAQMQNGKDTLADYIVKRWHTWRKKSFSHGLKKVMVDTFGVSFDFIEEWKVKDELPADYLVTVREALQKIGDEFRQIKPNVWIDLVLNNIETNIVISDCRYLNEAKAIKKRGGLNILLHRPGFENEVNHPSEAQLKPYIDLCIKSGQEGRLNWEKFCRLCGKKLLMENSWMEGGCPCNSCDINISELFDVFIVNDGTIEDLYRKADKLILTWKPVRKNYE